MLWNMFRLQIAELWFPYDHTIANGRRRSQTIADDHRRSQKIEHGSIFCEHGSIFCDRLRSSATTISGSQKIAEKCFHMIVYDRRTFCDLQSAIVCNHMETSLKPVNVFIFFPMINWLYKWVCLHNFVIESGSAPSTNHL